MGRKKWCEVMLRRLPGVAFLCLLWCVVMSGRALAEDLVSCRYLQSAGSEIVLEVEVLAPPPPTLIVVQHLPPGTPIGKASPRYKRYDRASGEAKWLLKGIRAGRLIMSLQLEQPLAAGAISGEIRYKDPRTGGMVTMRMSP